jgi:hypothetical protein
MNSQLHALTTLLPGEAALDTHWIGDTGEERKYLSCWILNSNPLAGQPVARCYTNQDIPALLYNS